MVWFSAGTGDYGDTHEHEDRNQGAEEKRVYRARVGDLPEQEEVGGEAAESAARIAQKPAAGATRFQ